MPEKLTDGQRAVLAALQIRGRYLDTHAVSRAAGKRLGTWAYEKLRALNKRGLVHCKWGDSKTLTTWIISDAGRSALAQEKGERALTRDEQQAINAATIAATEHLYDIEEGESRG